MQQRARCRARWRSGARADRGGANWLGAGLAASLAGWGANQFTPMLLLYRSQLGLSAAIVEAMFGLYAIGLIPGLLVGGSASDRIGRRPVVASALVLSMIGGGVLIIGAHGAGWLFAGRLVVGLASGSAFSAGAAWIKELPAPPYEIRAAGGGRAAGRQRDEVGSLLARWWQACRRSGRRCRPRSLPAAAGAHGLRAGTGHTNPGDREPEHGQQPRCRTVVADARPRPGRATVPAGRAAARAVGVRLGDIAMVYVPGLGGGQAPGIAVAFSAAVALCAALGGVAVQPLAQLRASHDHPERPRLLIAGLTLVIAGLLAGDGVAALGRLGPWRPVLVLVLLRHGGELGCGYGICLVFGLTEVARLHRMRTTWPASSPPCSR